MKPKSRAPEQDDLLRPRLTDMIDLRHEMVKLSASAGQLDALPAPLQPQPESNRMAYAKPKTHLRQVKARTFDTLFQSVAQTCELCPPVEWPNYFKAAGYAAN